MKFLCHMPDHGCERVDVEMPILPGIGDEIDFTAAEDLRRDAYCDRALAKVFERTYYLARDTWTVWVEVASGTRTPDDAPDLWGRAGFDVPRSATLLSSASASG